MATATTTEHRTWHVQTSLDPYSFALMCPWPDCGGLSPVDRSFIPELHGRTVHCRFCGLPSFVPDNLEELVCS
jgi:hypothetical protein